MSTSLEVGIVGLPNVGKSTLFNAITKAGAEAANYPFCTIEPNVGIVEVPDERLWVLSRMFNPQKTTATAMKFVDIAGLVKGASTGEGLGNKFLAHIREVDAVLQVVRCFADPNVTHVEGGIDPIRDIEIINTELCLADIETVEKRIGKSGRLLKSGDKKILGELDLLKKVLDDLSNGKPVRRQGLSEEELESLRDMNLLTLKPIMYAANVGEDEVGEGVVNAGVETIRQYSREENSEVVVISARIEAEIAELEAEEAATFLADMGLPESGLTKLINAAYKLLGLMHFFTAGEPEVRAWTIKRGTKAPQAAGKIHTDIERGFIRAEIVSFDDLVACGSQTTAREKGLVRLEGKEYIMKDGDVVYFRFNV